MEKTRITIVAVTCIALFFLTNYLFRYLIGFTGLLASLVIAALIAVYMSFSIARTLERLPMPEPKRPMLLHGSRMFTALKFPWKRALKGVKQIREGWELHLCRLWKVGRAAVDLAMEIGH